ncbi:MAG: dienelactone hydrolase family protein [Alphaproteobacteria bacterium]|nr:dienelactone hydrolase family protein [Alphaproteobacteria bacterium]
MTEEIIKRVTGTPLNRRAFAVTSLATGFALSVQPIAASSITTDATGLETGEAKIPVADGEIPAYFAKPAKGTKLKTVIVIQEIFGIHEWIKDVCRRFAKEGYFAVAPSLYSRQGDPLAYTDIQKLVAEIVMKVDDNVVLTDIDSTAKWAAGNGGDPAKLAVTGFCWGGRQTWLYTAHNPNVKAGVAWYGGLVRKEGNTQPKHPVEVAAQLKGRVLGLYGELDKGITLEHVEAMRAAIKAAGDTSEIIVYPGADHGFLADYRPTYHEASAKDAWGKCLAWFKRHGV